MTTGARPAVFLDRDGVLNEVRIEDGVAKAPRNVDELLVAPDAADSLARLRRAGYLLVVVSNQPEIARGEIDEEDVQAIHDELCRTLPIDAVYYCPHDGGDGCACRKPAPGMLLSAARDWGIDLTRSWLVGDRWVDVAAGQAAGVRSILLERPYSREPTSAGAPPADLRPYRALATLTACVDAILDHDGPDDGPDDGAQG